MLASYERYGIALYEGDTREMLPDLPLEDIGVVLTDPPYVIYGYLRDIDETHHLDMKDDHLWSNRVFEWVGQWMYPLRQRVRPDAYIWIFASTHYVGFYLRWARYAGWPLRGIFHCPPDEFLLAFGQATFSAEAGAEISETCLRNTYGQNKPEGLLRTLLRHSPPGRVFDPFAGHGSTLEAAKREGRPAIGVEIRPEFVRDTVMKWSVS